MGKSALLIMAAIAACISEAIVNDYGSTKNDLNYLPTLIANERSLAVNRFPSSGEYGYSTLCSFPFLVLARTSPSVQCLVLALSVLASHGQYPFTMLVPARSSISKKFQLVLKNLNIGIYRYQDIPIPPAGVRFHGSKQSWIISYQRVHMFRLPHKKVLFLDYDMVVIKNIDSIFSYPTFMIGSDCTPHTTTPPSPHRAGLAEENKAIIGAIELVAPSEDNFQLLYSLIQNGTILRAHGEVEWRWTDTDQSLLPAAFPMALLPCTYQAFPDLCLVASAPPLQHFPLDNFAILHFTWTRRKGVDFLLGDTFLRLLRKAVNMDLRWGGAGKAHGGVEVVAGAINKMSEAELAGRYVSSLI